MADQKDYEAAGRRFVADALTQSHAEMDQFRRKIGEEARIADPHCTDEEIDTAAKILAALTNASRTGGIRFD